jgi:hypothetical protein
MALRVVIIDDNEEFLAAARGFVLESGGPSGVVARQGAASGAR